MNLSAKMLSFDIETAEKIDFIDRKDDIPISIASTVTWNVSDGKRDVEELLWYSNSGPRTPPQEFWLNKSEMPRTEPPFSPGYMSKLLEMRYVPDDFLCEKHAKSLLEYLRAMQEDDFQVFAWNGAGFDLKVIGHAANNLALAGEIAMSIYDPMFQVWTERGYPVSLAAVGCGLGVKQEKTMNGGDAPQAWHDGEFERVETYVLGDSQITNEIILKIAQCGAIKWTSKKDKRMSMKIDDFLTVRECLSMNQTIASWMSDPPIRDEAVRWIPSCQERRSEKRSAVSRKCSSRANGGIARS